MSLKNWTVAAVLSLLSGCGDSADEATSAPQPTVAESPTAGAVRDAPKSAAVLPTNEPRVRWYSPAQVSRGRSLFAENCAVCHGAEGQGAFQWQALGPDGKLPPPPLNGTGHTWHHPLQGLGRQIKFGTPAGIGTMPGFSDKLTDDQILDTVAWFQSLWSDEIYRGWTEIEKRARAKAG